MYSVAKRQYILKQSSGKIWNIYFDNKLGLCYSVLTRSNTWSNPVSIQKDASPFFCADIDSNDMLHVMFQDGQGNILYSRLDREDRKTMTVLNSKSPTPYDKYLFLIPYMDSVNLFYLLQHNESWILAHQIVNNDNISTPRVIDYVIKTKCPYSALPDKSGNIYVFYQSNNDKHRRIGYKKYIPLQKHWEEFTPISTFSGDTDLPSTILDSSNIIHICYQRRVSKQYELVYQQKIPDKNVWTDEVVIHTSSYPFTSSSILICEDNIIIFWVRNDIIYYSFSNNMGSTWSKPSSYNFPAGKQLLCISYKTNNPYEYQKMAVRDVPGCLIGGIRIAFLPDITDSVENLSAYDFKKNIADALKLIKGDIDKLNASNMSIKEDMLSFNNSCSGLEKEMTKLSVRLGFLEKSISDIKLASSRLERRLETCENQIRKFLSLPSSQENTREEEYEEKE